MYARTKAGNSSTTAGMSLPHHDLPLIASATVSDFGSSAELDPDRTGTSKRRTTSQFCGCGRSRPKSELPAKMDLKEKQELASTSNLSEQEVEALYARFRRVACPNKTMTIQQFRGTLGILGMSQNNYLPDALYRVFTGGTGEELTYVQFIQHLAIMLRGTTEEKLILSFSLSLTSDGIDVGDHVVGEEHNLVSQFLETNQQEPITTIATGNISRTDATSSSSMKKTGVPGGPTVSSLAKQVSFKTTTSAGLSPDTASGGAAGIVFGSPDRNAGAQQDSCTTALDQRTNTSDSGQPALQQAGAVQQASQPPPPSQSDSSPPTSGPTTSAHYGGDSQINSRPPQLPASSSSTLPTGSKPMRSAASRLQKKMRLGARQGQNYGIRLAQFRELIRAIDQTTNSLLPAIEELFYRIAANDFPARNAARLRGRYSAAPYGRTARSTSMVQAGGDGGGLLALAADPRRPGTPTYPAVYYSKRSSPTSTDGSNIYFRSKDTAISALLGTTSSAGGAPPRKENEPQARISYDPGGGLAEQQQPIPGTTTAAGVNNPNTTAMMLATSSGEETDENFFGTMANNHTSLSRPDFRAKPAMISLEAYKNAVKHCPEFLELIGLLPSTAALNANEPLPPQQFQHNEQVWKIHQPTEFWSLLLELREQVQRLQALQEVEGEGEHDYNFAGGGSGSKMAIETDTDAELEPHSTQALEINHDRSSSDLVVGANHQMKSISVDNNKKSSQSDLVAPNPNPRDTVGDPDSEA
ncbi:unnamed protein product, partial [Amoebophrya sp. A120]|eukprot:GSA120T00008141001.1